MANPLQISKGKRILHFCNYSTLTSGIYPETRDLVREEMRVGYDPYLVDHLRQNPARSDPSQQDELFREGRVIGVEDLDEKRPADLLCWHSFMPPQILEDRGRDLVMFLHAMPSHVFYNELHGGEPVLSYLKRAPESLPQCRAFITLWPQHRPFWENVIEERLVVAEPILSTEAVRLKTDDLFDPRHLRLAVMDSWRGGKEPYYIVNAVQILMDRSRKGDLPFRVSLAVYGQGADTVPPVFLTLIRRGLEENFHFMGRAHPQRIFDTHDILLTQVGEIQTESRVIREALLAGVPVVGGHGNEDWTEYKHDCREIDGYAVEILRCWEAMQTSRDRRRIHASNRDLACRRWDIRRNAVPIFAGYERIFAGSELAGARGPVPAQGDGLRWDLLTRALAGGGRSGLQELAERLTARDAMSREEAVLRLLVDLPRC